MNSESTRQLIELSTLTDEERQLALEKATPGQMREYLKLVDQLSTLNVPPPSSAKKWNGRLQLLEAVEHYHQPSRRWPGVFTRWARAVPIAAAAGAVLTVSAAASVATDLELPGQPVSQVLSTLGLKSASDDKPAPDAPSSPGNLTGGLPQTTPEAQNGASGVSTATPEGSSGSDQRAGGENSGQVVVPPGQGGDNPGQSDGAPGQGGENPGQSDGAPGQGGENPGQGVDPPGQGGENPGQGVDPPGQGGENPGQGVDPPGQGGENPGQGVDPPGQGGENPGQSDGAPGQGGGDADQEQGNGQGQGNRP